MHDVSQLVIMLFAILAGILFNRHDVSNLCKDMGERFDNLRKDMGERFDKVDRRLDIVDGRIIELNRAVGNLEGRQASAKK